jgi:hypothetical protein
MKIRSCHGDIPDLASGRTERRDRKNEVDMMSKLHPCLRAMPEPDNNRDGLRALAEVATPVVSI